MISNTKTKGLNTLAVKRLTDIDCPLIFPLNYLKQSESSDRYLTVRVTVHND